VSFGADTLTKEGSVHVDFIRNARFRVGALAAVAALTLTSGTALAAPSKPKPRPKPTAPYITYRLNEVQIG
jgi:hypothetical protein